MPRPQTYVLATLNFDMQATGAKASCGLWYLPESSGSPLTLQTVVGAANAFRIAYAAAVADALPLGCRLTGVRLKQVIGGNEVEGESNNGVVVGAAAGESLPEEDVWCILKRTGLVGRSKRGRIFFPFVPEEYATHGNLTSDGRQVAAGLAGMVKSDVVASPNTYKPHHLDNKNTVLIPIVQSGYVETTCSRRDRRHPKRLTQVRV